MHSVVMFVRQTDDPCPPLHDPLSTTPWNILDHDPFAYHLAITPTRIRARANDHHNTMQIPDDPEGIIEMEVFSQIREMDEDDEDGEGGVSFSEGIVMGYFEQAEATFEKMEDALWVFSLWLSGGSLISLSFSRERETSRMPDVHGQADHRTPYSAAPDLPQLSSLGHFLKGSSAALGVIRVQNACEKIQHYGHKRDEERGVDLSEDEALKKIGQLLKDCKKDYFVAKGWLSKLYPDA